MSKLQLLLLLLAVMIFGQLWPVLTLGSLLSFWPVMTVSSSASGGVILMSGTGPATGVLPGTPGAPPASAGAVGGVVGGAPPTGSAVVGAGAGCCSGASFGLGSNGPWNLMVLGLFFFEHYIFVPIRFNFIENLPNLRRAIDFLAL